jgi:hypothetical protein
MRLELLKPIHAKVIKLQCCLKKKKKKKLIDGDVQFFLNMGYPQSAPSTTVIRAIYCN